MTERATSVQPPVQPPCNNRATAWAHTPYNPRALHARPRALHAGARVHAKKDGRSRGDTSRDPGKGVSNAQERAVKLPRSQLRRWDQRPNGASPAQRRRKPTT